MSGVKPLISRNGRRYELDSSTDAIAAEGLFFQGNSAYKVELLGNIPGFKKPDFSIKPIFLSSGDVSFVEFFNGATQTTPNRRAKALMAYDGSFNPTSETWTYYADDGTTVLRTVTVTYTITSNQITSGVEVTT